MDSTLWSGHCATMNTTSNIKPVPLLPEPASAHSIMIVSIMLSRPQIQTLYKVLYIKSINVQGDEDSQNSSLGDVS